MESLETEKTLLFKLYENGHFKNDEGVVARIDPYGRTVKIIDPYGSIKNIPFNKILGVEIV